jgi:endonuclease III related protein
MRRKEISLIYRRLYACFGPQKWWPARTRLEVMVGAVLTQNTSWTNVEKAIVNLRRKRLLTAEKLFRVPQKVLAELIRPSGYYNLKAERLKALTVFLMRSCQGELRRLSGIKTAFLRRQLLAIKGVGPETADSILLYALDRPVFVVDAYTKRIFSRHGLVKEDAGYDAVQALLMGNLKHETGLFNEYHALLVRLAKEFCLKTNPRCPSCPLKFHRRKNGQ